MASISGPTLSFSGVGSGIDTASMVAALMNVERMPVTDLQNKIKSVNTEKGVVQELNGQLGTLRTKMQALFSDTGAATSLAKKATVGTDTVVDATAAATASAGSYNITVNALAQNHTMASAANAPLTTGSALDITVGGNTRSFTVEAGDTLQTFADRINQSSDAGAQASVINNQLVFISKSTGTAGAITLGGSAAAGLGMTTTQAAQDASLTVNGVAVTSSSNEISNAVTGVTFNVKSVGTTKVDVANDDTAIVKKVQDFVDAYNALQSNMARVTSYDAATKTSGALQGDSLFRGMQSALRSVLGSVVQGQPDGANTLFAIGIDSSRSGQLSLDAGKLTAAIKADPTVLDKVFGASDGDPATSSASDGIARQIDAMAKQYSSGAIADRITGYGTTVRDMNDKIARMNDTLDAREKRLKAQFAAMDSAIAAMRNQQAEFSARLGTS